MTLKYDPAAKERVRKFLTHELHPRPFPWAGFDLDVMQLVDDAVKAEREACAAIAEQADCERQFVQPVIDAIRARTASMLAPVVHTSSTISRQP